MYKALQHKAKEIARQREEYRKADREARCYALLGVLGTIVVWVLILG